mmetsp:Transcript_9771/g.29405  ORF Transcript_9771/g.29405 Transcript_9771/m.29405 type:complete len:201 (-) Transcript_9771:82-684(-)
MPASYCSDGRTNGLPHQPGGHLSSGSDHSSVTPFAHATASFLLSLPLSSQTSKLLTLGSSIFARPLPGATTLLRLQRREGPYFHAAVIRALVSEPGRVVAGDGTELRTPVCLTITMIAQIVFKLVGAIIDPVLFKGVVPEIPERLLSQARSGCAALPCRPLAPAAIAALVEGAGGKLPSSCCRAAHSPAAAAAASPACCI